MKRGKGLTTFQSIRIMILLELATTSVDETYEG